MLAVEVICAARSSAGTAFAKPDNVRPQLVAVFAQVTDVDVARAVVGQGIVSSGS